MNSESQENEKREINSPDSLDQELTNGAPLRKPMSNISRPYMRDDLFKELMSHYQNADWKASLDAIEQLSKLYPGEPSLDDFREDIIMRSSLHQKGSRSQKVETRLRLQQRSGWFIVGIIAVLAIFFVGRWGLSQYQDQREENRLMIEATTTAKTLQTKFENAESYLRADRPEEALRLLEEIEAQSPGYPNIDELMIEAQGLIRLKELFQQGEQHFNDGELDAALQVLSAVEEEHPNYRNVSQLLIDIEELQQINIFTQEIADAFQVNDWAAVINGYEQILEINPNLEIPDIEEELFISYMNIIIEIADRPDATIEDIELAESYYRSALALFPQNREYADERAELERIATNLIVNKFHIYAVNLIDNENYSIQSIEQALVALQRANNINADSPAIAAEITTLQAYITAFNHYTGRRYDEAIEEFDNLLRSEPDFGGGRVNYMLYEAHIARGDLFLTYGDFANALEDFEAAETFAWEDTAGLLQLFEVEVRIGTALRKLSLYLESAEYFHYAANLVNLQEYIDPDQVEVLQAFNEAQVAYLRGQSWEASRLYDFVYEEANLIYPYETVRVSRGDSFVDFSFLYGSTIQALRDLNLLGDAMEARMNLDLMLPSIEEE
jgi:tetratricopeptide (TPR) repeat protein